MKKVLQQLVAAWLALTVSVAGLAGLSPWLHLLLEHGGRGTSHSHWDGARAHGSGRHVHAPLHDASAPHARHEHPDHDGTSSSPPPAGHQHDSLAQLLAHGLIDLPLPGATFAEPLAVTKFKADRISDRLFAREIDPTHAGRGPPPVTA